MRTYRVHPSRHTYLYSRPLGSDGRRTHHQTTEDFSEAEMVLNPWDTIEDVPEEERAAAGPFGLARQFRTSYWIFHRDGFEWIVMWCNLHVLVDGVDCGMSGTLTPSL